MGKEKPKRALVLAELDADSTDEEIDAFLDALREQQDKLKEKDEEG